MTQTPPLTVEPRGREVHCREDQSILDARLRAGLDLANAAVVGLLLATLCDPVFTSAVFGPLDLAWALVALALLLVLNGPYSSADMVAVAELIAINAGTLLLVALLINRMLLRRRYPQGEILYAAVRAKSDVPSVSQVLSAHGIPFLKAAA